LCVGRRHGWQLWALRSWNYGEGEGLGV
jgi:hypothetical protein